MRPYHRALVLLLLIGAVFQVDTAAGRVKHMPNRLSVTVQHNDIAELYHMLSRQNNVNILLAPDVVGEVSVNLYDVTLDEAIYSIAAAGGFVVERMNNSYIISKGTEAGKTIAGGLTDMRTFKIQYSDAKRVSEVLKSSLSRFGKIDVLDERNLMVIEDLPDFLERMSLMIDDLDREPSQVLIESKILRVKLDDTETFGLDWSQTFSAAEGEGIFGLQGLAAPGSPGFFFAFLNNNLEVTLNALSRKGRVQTLATPKLLALEHQEAQVIIGSKTGYRVTTTINQVTQESIEFLQSGVILKVTPYIDRSGRIMMEIHPEVSTSTVSDGIPSLETTEVTTRLLVEDGQTVFIGGLMQNDVTNRQTGVPILGDIPLLGRLFSNSEEITFSTETVVLIKPQIVHAGNAALITLPKEDVEHRGGELENDAQIIDDYFESRGNLLGPYFTQ